MMKLGIDLDDVRIDFFPSFLNFYNKKYGKNFSMEDMTSFYIWEIGIGKNREEAIKLVDDFYDSPEFDLMPLVTGAEEAINKLFDFGHELHTITSRPLRFQYKTELYLKKHFPNHPLNINYAFGLEEQKNTKADICEKLGIKIMIEDAPKHIELCASRGIRALVMDKPWNQNLNGKFERVYSWEDILKKLNL